MSEKTKEILRVVLSIIIAACTAALTALGLTSCNVTRVVSTASSYWTKGDTTCTIVTKTTESYDAKKNASVGF